MKMTYNEAITKYNALSEVEKGRDAEHPYDLPWEAWILITTMMNALQPYVEGYQKGRMARFKRASKVGGTKQDQFGQPTIDSPEEDFKFRMKEEKILSSYLNILMPVSKLELNFEKNRYNPTLLIRLKDLYTLPEAKGKFELEEGEASPISIELDEDTDGDAIKMNANG